MFPALKCLSDNFNISAILVMVSVDSLFIPFMIFPGLGMVTNFLSKHEHLHIILWSSGSYFKSCILAGFLQSCSCKGRAGFYRWREVEVQISRLAAIVAEGGWPLLLILVGGLPASIRPPLILLLLGVLGVPHYCSPHVLSLPGGQWEVIRIVNLPPASSDTITMSRAMTALLLPSNCFQV